MSPEDERELAWYRLELMPRFVNPPSVGRPLYSPRFWIAEWNDDATELVGVDFDA